MGEALDAPTDALEEIQQTDITATVLNAGSTQESFDKPLVWPCGKGAAIAYVDNVFAPEFCANLIALCEQNSDKSFYGKTMGGVRLDTKVSTDWHLEQASDLPQNQEQEFDKRIFQQLWRVLDLYKNSIPQLCDRANIDKSMVSDSGYQIQKYLQNVGYYSEHIDGSCWVDGARGRVLGVVVYLNTVDIGGGTHFPMHNITIDAVVGRVALFPANWTHPHCGIMPMSGDKWIISTFVFASTGDSHGSECKFCREEEMVNSHEQ